MDIQVNDYVTINGNGPAEYQVQAIAGDWALVQHNGSSSKTPPVHLDNLTLTYRPAAEPNDNGVTLTHEEAMRVDSLIAELYAANVCMELRLTVTSEIIRQAFISLAGVFNAIDADDVELARERLIKVGTAIAASSAELVGINVFEGTDVE